MKRAALALGALGALAIIARSSRSSGASSSSSSSSYPWLAARSFSPADRKDVRVIVIHTTEAPKTDHTAMNVAKWTNGPDAKVSAHFVVDSDNVVQTVREKDVAWHARSANPFSIGVEHAGSAAQNAAQWDDDFNRKMLRRSAELVAGIAHRWDIPIRWLSAEELRAPGARGITGHRECTDAFENGQGHGDPGPNFPRAHYIELVRARA